MNSMDTLTSFFGWCSVINVGLLSVATFVLIFMRAPVSRIHENMFDLSATDLSRAYFQYLAHYKIAILVFNVVPYIALKLTA